MKLLRKVGVTSEIWQVFIQDSSSATGQGLSGLTNLSSSLAAYFHRDTDTTATVINLVSMTVGTYTSSGFKEIDSANMKGWYQFCPPNAALASGAKSCAFHLAGATNMAPLPIEVDLQGDVNVTHIAGTASVGTAGYMAPDWGHVNAPTTSVNLSGTTIATTQQVDVNTIKTQTVTCAGGVTIPAATLASTTNITAGTITTVTTVTNQLTAAQIATGVWQDTTAGDFTVGLSVGKSLMNGVSLGTGLTVARCTLTDTLTTYTGNTVQTGDSFARIGSAGAGLTNIILPSGGLANVTTWTVAITGNVTGNLSGSVGSVTGLTASNLDTTVSSRLATTGYTAPDNTSITAIKAKTDNLPASPAAVGSAMTLSAAYDYAKGTVAMTEAYAANGVAPTPVQAVLAIHQMLMNFIISGTGLTVHKLDGVTTAFQVTLNDATTPSGAARS